MTKTQFYAEAAVPFHLLVDPDEAGTTRRLRQLEGGRYVRVAVARRGERVQVTEPSTIDLVVP